MRGDLSALLLRPGQVAGSAPLLAPRVLGGAPIHLGAKNKLWLMDPKYLNRNIWMPLK